MVKYLTLLLSVIFAVSITFNAAAKITVDEKKHSVTFTALSTDCGMDTPLEFLFVSSLSDRDYESMFVLEDPIEKLAEAFAKAKIMCGKPTDEKSARFWPVGSIVEMEPSFNSFVREMHNEKTPSILYTGGARDEKGGILAATNMPSAFFALYSCSQSLLQLNDRLDQSVAYGRFQCAVKIPKGERRTFTFSLSEKQTQEPLLLKFDSKNLADSILLLKEKSAKKELDVTTSFSSDMSLKEAIASAKALSLVDSVRVKINSFSEGEFFFRAFLPLDSWRNRKDRLAQPPEVHIWEDGKYSVFEIKEDWSDPDELDPKLSTIEHKCETLQEVSNLISKIGERTSSVLIFAPESITLEKLYLLKKNTKKNIVNWYLFSEIDSSKVLK